MSRFVALSLGALVVAAALRVPAFEMPLDRDLAAYATIGRLGGLFEVLPYRDVFDHKQPLIYVVFWLLDLVAPQKVGAIRLAAAVPPALAASLLVCVLQPRIGGVRAGAAGLLVLICSASTLVEGTDLNTEHLLVLTAALPVLAALAWEHSSSDAVPLGVGVLVGLAVLTKAVGIFVAPAALLPLLAARERSALRAVLLVAVGTALPLMAVALGYLAVGALGDLWYANYTYNRLYVEAGGRRLALPSGSSEVVTLAGAALGMAIAALSARRDRSVLGLTLVAWLAGTAVGAQLSGRSFAHYYAPLVVPACALLCLPVAPSTWGGRSPRALVVSGLAAVVAVVVAAPFARSVARTYGKSGSELAYETYGAQAQPWTAAFAVGAELRRRSGSKDRMFVLGAEPEFYWTSDVRPASYYIYDRPAGVDRERYIERVERDVCASPPRWLVHTEGREDAPPPSCVAGLAYRPVLHLGGVELLELTP